MMMNKLKFLSVSVLCMAMLGGCGGDDSADAASAGERCPHEIKAETCPFCTPELIESDGFCGAHGFPEAMCAQCRPFLKTAFRSKGDWCEEHKLPESQCVDCNPEIKENIRPGEHGTPISSSQEQEASCEHKIAEAKCPFCTPSLIESEGFCSGHGVPEALCVACRPFLKTAFIEKGDWCQAHDTPESQCDICNP